MEGLAPADDVGPLDRIPDPTADEALRHLHHAHGSVLLGFLVRLTHGDRHRAEDILQETLLRAWRHPQARGPDGEWSRAWLITVARRIAIDQARAATIRPHEMGDELLDLHPTEGDDVERLIEMNEVRDAVADLPERLRRVIVEIYFEERSVAETADRLGVPQGTVKSRTFYALRALRANLLERGFSMPPRW